MEGRSVVLATNGYLSNTRCYMVASGGDVYEAALQLSARDLESVTSQRPIKQSREWTFANLTLDCDDTSSLHCQVWDSSRRSIFYQDRSSTLREWRFVEGQRWERTGFQLANVKIGSKMAIVPAAYNTGSMLVFFQDTLGYVRCCTIEDGRWEAPDNTNGVAIALGSPSTGIGACLDANQNDVCVYFQDETFAVREYRKHGGIAWLTKGDIVTTRDGVVTDIAAVTYTISGRHSTRLYFQDTHGAITEGARSSSEWMLYPVASGSITSAGILAVPIASSRFHVGLVWAGTDENLHMCGYDDVQLQGWSHPVDFHFEIPASLRGKTCFDRPYTTPGFIAPHARPNVSLLPPNGSRSSWPPRSPSLSVSQLPTPNSLGHSGARPRSVPHDHEPQLRVPDDGHGHSTVAHSGAPRRVHTPNVVGPPGHGAGGRAPRAIRRVCMRVSCCIADLKVVYEDGNETSWCSTSGAREEAFVLLQDEYITHVWYVTDGSCIQGVLFGTSSGRTSKWFGQEYGIYGLLSSDGSVLVSLYGSSHDGQMSALKPTWEPHTPHSELAGYRTRHGELETRWSVLQSAVAELEGHSDSTAISVRKLSTCEIDIVRGVAELVEKVEILRGQELEASTAKVAVTPLRRDYHHSHLNVCRDSARAVVVHFNKLAAALELAARQYDSPRQSHHREGEKLLSDIRMLRDDVQAYLHKINQQIGSVQSEKTFWTAEADRAHVVFANDKEVFNRTLSLKHIEVARLTEQGETSWDLQQWSNTLNLAPIEDAREHYITSQVLKSAGRFHFCATRAAFYERHDSLLSSHHREASGLHVESMISALQSLVGSLGSPDIAAAALKSAQELSPLTEMSTRLLVQVQDASLAREFARNLADVLEAVVKTHSFDCGAINAKELLNICTNIADQPSPGYIAVPF